MAQASLKQVVRLLELVVESGWSREEFQRRLIEQWGLIRDIATALGEGKVSEEQVRSMHPLFYKKPTPSELIAADLIPSGYKVVEDVLPTLNSAADLDLASFLEPDEDYVPGETMRARAKAKKANLGLADLKVALADQTKIPEEARQYYIVFSGTVLRYPLGDLCVAYLYWRGGRWLVSFCGVAGAWRGRGRLARCK